MVCSVNDSVIAVVAKVVVGVVDSAGSVLRMVGKVKKEL